MKEIALMDQAREALLKCLQGVPFLRVEKGSKAANGRSDLRLQVKTPGGKSTLVVEVRKVGQPRVIREATNQLLRFKNELPGAYGVVMAPYISPQAAEICLKEGFGFADLAGNCLLSFDQVFISKEGKENPFARKRDLRSLYSPKAERVLRVLLSAPGRRWKVQPLAKEAGVSLGQGFNVKKLLVDREWMETGDDGFRLTAPAKLLAEWEENYDFRRSTVREFYTLRPIADFERRAGRGVREGQVGLRAGRVLQRGPVCANGALPAGDGLRGGQSRRSGRAPGTEAGHERGQRQPDCALRRRRALRRGNQG